MTKQIIKRPIVSEKSLNLVETENQYTFIVDPKANKKKVKKSVEKKFEVTVLSVRIMNYLGKRVTFGRNRIQGFQPDFKKAIVTLKKGDTIADFDIK